MLVEIYVETTIGEYERLDMFDDENININYKLKDLGDISKVFSTYSQTFTIPASPKNNQILNHYFSPEVISAKNRVVNSKLYINKKIYKFGKLSMSNGKQKLNNLSQYSINFISGVGSLKDIVGETTLSNLDVFYPISWTGDNFYFSMTEEDYSEDWYVPLISNKRVWTYGAGTNDIKWINSSTEIPKAIDYTELRPAIRFGYVMDKIIENFGLNIEAPLFNRTEYSKLYIHLTKEKLETKKIIMDIQNAFGSYVDQVPPGYPALPHAWDVSANLSTNVFTISWQNLDAFSSIQTGNFFLRMTPNIIFPISENLSAKVEYIDLRPTSPTFGSPIFEQTINGTEGSEIISALPLDRNFYGGVGLSNPLIFRVDITFNTIIGLTDVNYGIDIRRPGSLSRYSKLSFGNSLSSGNSVVNIWSLIPEIKIIDFLSSFFKMFNIRVIEDNNSDKLYFETPQDFIGVEKDYTEYIDIDETAITPQTIFKTYKFTHANSKYRSNVDAAAALVNNANSKAFGQLLYTNTLDYASGEYTIETKFSIVPQKTITNTLVETQYGFDSSAPVDDATYGPVSNGGLYKQNWGELTLLYKNGLVTPTDLDNEPISFGIKTTDPVFPDETLQISQYVKSGLSDFDTPELYTNSLGFKDEVNILPIQFVYSEHNLYQNNYNSLIQKINSPNSYIYTFEGYLPPKEVLEFDMRNSIIIGERKYDIEEASINIVTGKSKLLLINKGVLDIAAEE